MSGGRKTRKEKLRRRKLKPPACAICGKAAIRKIRIMYGCLVHEECVSDDFKKGN